MSTLFEITKEYMAFYEMIADEETDLAVIEDTLESLDSELETKAAGYVAVMKQIEMEADKADQMSEAWKAKADRRRNAIKRIKDRLLHAMNTIGKKKVEAGDYTISVQKNGGVLPLNITGRVPESFCKITIEPDNGKIRQAIEEGKNISFANLGERGSHIVIR